jgi:hypothetical protein
MLSPKCTKIHKYIKGKFKGCKVNSTQLCFGKYGMKSCQASRICIKHVILENFIINIHNLIF